MTSRESQLTFFRQSGWMVLSTTAMGVFMYAVHKIAKEMPKAEYGVFTTLLQVLNLMGMPAIGLQSVFAQQAASATTDASLRQLRAAVRAITLWTFVLWVVTSVVVVLARGHIAALLQIANPAAIWATLIVGLASLWLPVWVGLLQGRQKFLWLGWSAIANGAGRFGAVGVIVLGLGGYAAGAMTGALIGIVVSLAIAVACNRDLLTGASTRFDYRSWLARVVPLTFGLGVAMFVLSIDMIIVQSLFDRETTGLYAAAGMIGRALVFFTVPVSSVMFPKIVQAAATSAPSAVLGQALGITALLGVGAAGACTLLPWLPLKVVYDDSFLVVAPLVPWFAWCMLPLTLSNVLINHLMARARYDAVPWLVVTAAGYGAALMTFNDSFETVVKTLGVFGVILFGVSAWFTWFKAPPSPAPVAAPESPRG